MTRLSLAAGTVLDATPIQAIEAASGAGFSALGLRLHQVPTAAELAETRAALEQAQLRVLDVEVIRLRAGTDVEQYFWLVDAAGALGARFLLVVSEDPDQVSTSRSFAALCRRADQYGLRPALEFMRFTAVKTLADAVEVLDRAGQANGSLLIDALHLARSGGHPEQLAGIPPTSIGYVQICDGPLAGPVTDAELADEARHHRLMPGAGELPLAALLAAVARDVPVSVEVQSDELAAQATPAERARQALAAARSLTNPVGE